MMLLSSHGLSVQTLLVTIVTWSNSIVIIKQLHYKSIIITTEVGTQ